MNEILVRPKGNRIFILMAALLIITVIIDNLLSNLAFDVNVSSFPFIVIFTIEVLIFSISVTYLTQYLIKNEPSNKYKNSKKVNTTIALSNLFICGLLIFLLSQVLIFHEYNLGIIIVGITISFVSSMIILSILCIKLLSWYFSEKSLIMLLYAVSIIVMILRIGSLIYLENTLLLDLEVIRNADSEIIFVELNEGSMAEKLGQWYSLTSIISYVLLWVSNAFFLRNHFTKFTELKYFIIVCLLPAFTMLDYFFNYTYFQSENVNPIIFDIFVTFEGVISGIILAIPFLTIIKKIRLAESHIKIYLIATSIGFIIFGNVGSTIIDHAPYPPFGFISFLSLQFSTLVMYISLYRSAISFSLDNVLRRSISKEIDGAIKLYNYAASAEMKQRIINLAMESEKRLYNKLSMDAEISPSLDLEDIQKYVKMVLAEKEKKGNAFKNV